MENFFELKKNVQGKVLKLEVFLNCFFSHILVTYIIYIIHTYIYIAYEFSGLYTFETRMLIQYQHYYLDISYHVK